MILVTAPAGAAGFPIITELSRLNAPTRALLRDPAKASQWNLPNVQPFQGDLLDAASLESAMSGVDTLMLTTPPVPNQAEMDSAALAAAKKCGVRRIVKFSSAGADPKSPARFCRGHGQGEKEIEKSGLTWTHLRPTFFSQNLFGMASMVKQGAIHFDAADGKAPFVDLADVAAVAGAVLTTSGHDHKRYEITGPTAYGYGDIAAIFSRWLERPVKYVPISHAAAITALTGVGIPQWNAEGITELSEEMARGNFARPTDVVRRLTGKSPKSLECFLRENLAAFS